jgi:hypothetical protein
LVHPQATDSRVGTTQNKVDICTQVWCIRQGFYGERLIIMKYLISTLSYMHTLKSPSCAVADGPTVWQNYSVDLGYGVVRVLCAPLWIQGGSLAQPPVPR